MSDSSIKPIHIDLSADGKRNRYVLHCSVMTQSMNYAACLWRQNVLSAPNIKTPADWEPCKQARCAGNCKALELRQEELLKGESIYFEDRERPTVTAPARKWVDSAWNVAKTTAARVASVVLPTPTPTPAPVKKDVFDVMGDMPSYAEAINKAAEAPSVPSVPIVEPKPVTPFKAMQGESPLQLARRLAAERAAKS